MDDKNFTSKITSASSTAADPSIVKTTQDLLETIISLKNTTQEQQKQISRTSSLVYLGFIIVVLTFGATIISLFSFQITMLNDDHRKVEETLKNSNEIIDKIKTSSSQPTKT